MKRVPCKCRLLCHATRCNKQNLESPILCVWAREVGPEPSLLVVAHNSMRRTCSRSNWTPRPKSINTLPATVRFFNFMNGLFLRKYQKLRNCHIYSQRPPCLTLLCKRHKKVSELFKTTRVGFSPALQLPRFYTMAWRLKKREMDAG